MQNDVCKDEIGETSLRANAIEMRFVLRVHLKCKIREFKQHVCHVMNYNRYTHWKIVRKQSIYLLGVLDTHPG